MTQVQTQHKPMTLDEKLTVQIQAIELRKAGDLEEYQRLMKTVPMPSYQAKVIKDKLGLDFLLNLNWNLAEAEAEFGPDWLSN